MYKNPSHDILFRKNFILLKNRTKNCSVTIEENPPVLFGVNPGGRMGIKENPPVSISHGSANMASLSPCFE
jgi:hypothetical protein